MKLIEYKPHDKWFIWIHPCYIVETTTNSRHGLDNPFYYYYGRTHLSESYRKSEEIKKRILEAQKVGRLD